MKLTNGSCRMPVCAPEPDNVASLTPQDIEQMVEGAPLSENRPEDAQVMFRQLLRRA